MCGILGVVRPGVEQLSDADLHRARIARDTLRHRGPDQYPESVLYYRGMLKGALKHAYEDTLPDATIRRAKKGFSIPLHEWDRSLKQDGRRVFDLSLLRYLVS